MLEPDERAEAVRRQVLHAVVALGRVGRRAEVVGMLAHRRQRVARGIQALGVRVAARDVPEPVRDPCHGPGRDGVAEPIDARRAAEQGRGAVGREDDAVVAVLRADPLSESVEWPLTPSVRRTPLVDAVTDEVVRAQRMERLFTTAELRVELLPEVVDPSLLRIDRDDRPCLEGNTQGRGEADRGRGPGSRRGHRIEVGVPLKPNGLSVRDGAGSCVDRDRADP